MYEDLYEDLRRIMNPPPVMSEMNGYGYCIDWINFQEYTTLNIYIKIIVAAHLVHYLVIKASRAYRAWEEYCQYSSTV